MPIVNMDLRKQKLPQAMNIRKGIKVPVMDKKTKKPKINQQTGEIVTVPKEVEYFVMHYDVNDEVTPKLIEKAYGTDKPTKLNAFLAYANYDKTWDYWWEAYTYSQLVARSDGAVVTLLFDITNGQRLIERGHICEMPKNHNSIAGKLILENNLGVGDILGFDENMVVADTSSDPKNPKPILFDAVGRLSVIIPEAGRYATALVHTGGRWNDVPHITEMVNRVFEIASTTNLAPGMIPITLTRVYKQGSYADENGKKHKTDHWNIQMEIAPQIFKGLLKAYHDTPIALLASTPPMQYDAPEEELPMLPAYIADSDEPFQSFDAGDYEEEIHTGEILPPDAESIQEPTERPFSPEALKDWFDVHAKQYQESGAQIYEKGAQVVAKALKIVLPDDTDRYAFTGWITGNPSGSTKSLKTYEILALADLMDIDVTGKQGFGQVPSATSVKEIQKALEFSNALKGQLGMELGEQS